MVHTVRAQIVHVSVVPYSYLCGISLVMIYLGSFSVKNCKIFMGLIYPFMLCYVHDFIAGEYSWQDEGGSGDDDDDDMAIVYFHVILFVRDDFIMEQKWLWFFVASYCNTI